MTPSKRHVFSYMFALFFLIKKVSFIIFINIPLIVFDYDMIPANSTLDASLVLHHLILRTSNLPTNANTVFSYFPFLQ